jgi:CO/xanthine dehydrogenase Mo-binding subunit
MFVGRDCRRLDVVDKVLGKPVFAWDMKTEGMLFASVFRGTRPHAVIRCIDTREALSLAGVVRILSWRDIPGENLFGAIKRDTPYLAEEKVRYAGEPILLVVAATEEIARKAQALITVEYEELSAISDPFSAMESPVHIHNGGNLLSHRTLIKGDVERGFGESEVILSHTYRTSWLDHAYMETEAGVGYTGEDGRIVIHSSTQNIHYKRREISRLLALPEERIRLIQAATGGGFGGKLDVTVEGFLALAVYHTQKPVIMRYTREESFLANTKRHPLHIEYMTGAGKDGKITAVKVNIVGDTGPYISYGETVCLRSAIHATGPYEVPNVHVDSRMFYTNNPISGAMRGFGIPQLAFAHESQMDGIAEALRIDPLDVRIINGLRKGSLTATSQVLDHSVGFVETLRCVEPLWRNRKRTHDGQGFGLGCMYYGIGNTGVSNPSSCSIELTEEGKIVLYSGVCEIGQGSDTVLLQILMETLNPEEGEEVVLERGDTDRSCDAGSSSASRQTYISGSAVYDAASRVKVFLEGQGYYRGRSIREIARKTENKESLRFDGRFDPPMEPVDPRTSRGVPYATYAFATHMTELEVDRDTGFCRVKKVHAAHDVGRAVNPKNVKGQIYGGIAMGIGLALLEEFVPSETESLDSYYLPTSMDMPEVEVHIVEDAEPTGPFGAKGVGEPALIPQAASIMNGIVDAVGARGFELPCHMERLKALIEDQRGRDGR